MPTSVTLHVFRSGVEMVPPMCMFCAKRLDEEHFEKFTVQVGHGMRMLELPICYQDRSSATVHYPDGRSVLLDAVADANIPYVPGAGALPMAIIFTAVMAAKLARNLQRHQESIQTTFTFDGVHRKFVAELEHIRHLSDREYDALMAKANEKFVAMLHAGVPTDTEKRRQQVEQQAADSAMFGMEETKGAGEMSVEVTRSNRNKFLLVGAIIVVVSMLLVTCIGAGAIGYMYWSKKPPADDLAQKKPALPSPQEQKARIKEIDVGRSTVRLLIGDGKFKTFPIADKTGLLDADGKRLELKSLAAHRDADVMILTTDDREGLQWLKLTK